MKIKSFNQFLNEFEVEGDVVKEGGVSPFSPSDQQKVNSILSDYRHKPIIKEFTNFIDDLAKRYSNGEIEHSYLYLKTSKGTKEMNYWIYGPDHDPNLHNGLFLYEGTTSAFTDLENGINLIDEEFGWGTDLMLFNYDVLPNEEQHFSSHGLYTGELNGVDFDGAAVFHSVKQFQQFIDGLEAEIIKILPELKQHIIDFCEKYGIKK